MSYLVIDFDNTQTRFVRITDDYQIQQQTAMPLDTPQDIEQTLMNMIDTARTLVSDQEMPAAIAVSVPGLFDRESGMLLQGDLLPDWYDVPLREVFQSAFETVPVMIFQNASLTALAEYHTGAGRDTDSLIYIAVGSVVRGAAIIQGQILTGWRGLATAPGMQLVPLPDRDISRLEDIVSGQAIVHEARKWLSTSEIRTTLRDVDHLDARTVGEAAVSGDDLARSIVKDAGHYLGIGLVNSLHLFNPQAIVIGGQVALQLWDLLIPPARKAIHAHLMHPAFYHDDLIRPARLDENACLIGAVYAVQQAHI